MASNGNTNGATSPALKGLNFNEALKRERVPIAKGDQQWDLRDDVPTDIIVRVTMAEQLDKRWQEEADRLDAEHATVAEIRAAMTAVLDEVRAEWCAICTGIFQYTYPKWTEEDTARTFNLDEQRAVSEAFFLSRALRMNGSSLPASATSPAPAKAAAPARRPTRGRR